MKRIAYLLFITCLILIYSNCLSQKLPDRNDLRIINFYVVNKPRTLDLFSRSVIWRARQKARRHSAYFKVIVSNSLPAIKQKIINSLTTEKAHIGTLWFDTHGHYANGYSSFCIGKLEFNYKTILDTSYVKSLSEIAAYCNERSDIIIGSCYGGATFERKDKDGNTTGRMNGDSLMIGLAAIFKGSTVYGTESWVMTKPGIFHEHSYALAGYPLQKRFKDEIYKPVWQRMGIWHRYNAMSEIFETVNTVSLSRMGSLQIKSHTYLDNEKHQKRLHRNLKKLKPGLAKR